MDLGSLIIDIQLKANSAIQGLNTLKTQLENVRNTAEQMQKALYGSTNALNSSATAFNGISKASLASLNINTDLIKSDKDLAKVKEELTNRQDKLTNSIEKYQKILERIKNKYSDGGQDVVDKFTGVPSKYQKTIESVQRNIDLKQKYQKTIESVQRNIDLKQKELSLVSDVGSKIDQNTNLIIDQNNQIKKGTDKVKKNTKEVHEQAAAYRTLSLYAVAAFTGIVMAIKKASDAYSQYSAAMSGLKALSIGTGNSFNKLQKDLEDYTKDGLIPAAEAATALKNLLARGYTDVQAIEILNRLKDSAAYNRQAALSMGQAIASATEGLKNENSILVDNAGVVKNVSKMWEEYADSIGKTKNELTLQEKIQAEYNGIMKETSYFVGNSTRYAQAYAGQLAKTGAGVRVLNQNFGEALAPTLQYLNEILFTSIGNLSIFIKENKTLVNTLTFVTLSIVAMFAALTTVKAVTLTLATSVKVLGDALGMTNATLLTLATNPVVILFTALAAAVGLATVKNAEYNKTLKERKKQEEEEIKILEKLYRLQDNGITPDEKDIYKTQAEKARYYLNELKRIDQEITDLTFFAFRYDKKDYDLLPQSTIVRIEEAKAKISKLSEQRKKLVEEAKDEDINLTSKQAIINTEKYTKEQEKQLELFETINLEATKSKIKQIASTQSTIQSVKNLIKTYKEAKEGTSDWVEAEKKLAELYPEFSTLSGIKLEAIENEIKAKELQNKADWIIFKDEKERNLGRLEAIKTKCEAIGNLINIKSLEARIRSGDTSAYAEIQEALKAQKTLKDKTLDDAIKYHKEIANMDINTIPGYTPERNVEKTVEKTAYEKAIELYEHRKNLGKLTKQDEIKVLEDIKKAHARTTKEIWDAEERIYNARLDFQTEYEKNIEKEFKDKVTNSERWVKQQKIYNKDWELEEIAAYDRIINYHKDHLLKIENDTILSEEKKKEIREATLDAIEDYEASKYQVIKEWNKKTLDVSGKFIDDNIKNNERLINQLKLRNKINEDQEISMYNGIVKKHKAKLKIIEADTTLSEEERQKQREATIDDIEDVEDKIYSIKKAYIDKYLDDYIESLEDEIDASEKAELEKLKDKKEAIKKEYETIDEEKESADRAEKLAELRKREALYQNAATKDGLEELKKIKDDIKDLEDKEEKQRLKNEKETRLDELDAEIKTTETKYDTMRKQLKDIRKDMENEVYNMTENIGINLTNAQLTIANKFVDIFNDADVNITTLLNNMQKKLQQAQDTQLSLDSGSIPKFNEVNNAALKVATNFNMNNVGNLVKTQMEQALALFKQQKQPNNVVINDYGNKNFNSVEDYEDFENELKDITTSTWRK